MDIEGRVDLLTNRKDSNRSKNHKQFWLWLGFSIVAFTIGTMTVLVAYEHRKEIITFFSGDTKEIVDVGEEIPPEPEVYHYWYAPENSFGVSEIKTLNWTYWKSWLNDNTAWRLQASPDNETWYNADELLTVSVNWNETNQTAKITLTLNTTNAPTDLYYRFDLAVNKSVKDYVNKSSNYEYILTLPANQTEDYEIFFNWSDIKPLIQNDKVIAKHGIKNISGNEFFWFRIRSVNKIPIGTVFEIDPTFGQTYIGAVEYSLPDRRFRASSFYLSEAGTITDMYLYTDHDGGFGGLAGIAVFYDNGSEPYDHVVNLTGISPESGGWTHFDITDTNLVSGYYWLGVWSDYVGGKQMQVYYNATGGDSMATYAQDYPCCLDDPIQAWMEDSTRLYSVYATYTPSGPPNIAPTITGENPSNQSTGIVLQPTCNVTVTDDDGDTMDVTFATNESGSWVNKQTNSSVSNGSYSWDFTDADTSGTKYWWRVYCDDATVNISETYYFTTNYAPTQSEEAPTNGSVDVSLEPDLYVICSDTDGDQLNATWWSNSSGSWVQFGSNETSFASGTNITQNNSNFSSYNTKYWWSVNLTDGHGKWNNETYQLTTLEQLATSVDSISPYWQDQVATVGITATADSGTPDNVTLWYRWSTDNTTWDEMIYGEETLNVTDFDETINNWDSNAGADPWLIEQDQPTNYISEASTADVEIAWFDFADTTLTGTIYVNLSIYCNNDDGAGNDYADVYVDYTGSGSGSDVGDVAQHTAWSTDIINLGSHTVSEVNNLRVKFYYRKSGGGDDVRIDQAYLTVNSSGVGDGYNWSEWSNANNPDLASPWAWTFDCPNETGYHEFYSIANKSGNPEDAPVSVDALCHVNYSVEVNNPPTQTGEAPVNGSTNIDVSEGVPDLYVICNDVDGGDLLNATWWSNSSGSWLQFGDNETSFSLGTNITQTNSNFSTELTTYWWSVNLTDGNDGWNNETYYFSTATNETRQPTQVFNYWFNCGNTSARQPTEVFNYWFDCGNESVRSPTLIFDHWFSCGNTSARQPTEVFDYWFDCGNGSVRTPTEVFNYYFLCGNETARSPTEIFDYWFNCGNTSARESTEIFDYWFDCGNTSYRVETEIFNYWFNCGNTSIRQPTNIFDYYFNCGNETTRTPTQVFDYYFACGNETYRTPIVIFDHWFACGNTSARYPTEIFNYWFQCSNESVRSPTKIFDYYFNCGNESVRTPTTVFNYCFLCGNVSEIRTPTEVFNYYFLCGNETARTSIQIFNYWFDCGNETVRNPYQIFDHWFSCGNTSIRTPTEVFDYWFDCGNETYRTSTTVFNHWFSCGNVSGIRTPTMIFDYWFDCGNETARNPTLVFNYWFSCGNESYRQPTQIFDHWFSCGNTSARQPTEVFNYWFDCGNESVRSPTLIFDHWFSCGNTSIRTPTEVFDYWFDCGNGSVRTPTEVFNYYFLCGNETARSPTEIFDYWFNCGNTSARESTEIFDYWFDCGNITVLNITISNPYPANSSTNIQINTSMHFTVTHLLGFTMNITIYTGSNLTNCSAYLSSFNSVNNGTYYMGYHNASELNTSYAWNVNVTDAYGNYAQETYSFITTTSEELTILPIGGNYIIIGGMIGILAILGLMVLLKRKKRKFR